MGECSVVSCPHTAGINCDDPSKCKVCGWKPDVTAKRKEAIQAGKMKKDKGGLSYLKIKKVEANK